MPEQLTAGGVPVYRDSGGVLRESPTEPQIEALAAKVATKADVSDIPKPATSAPPPVQVDSEMGDNPRYALENHTHESRLQARRVQVTPDANGRVVYAFPKAYATGIVPIVEVLAETPAGAGYLNVATIEEGSTTNKQTVIRIAQVSQSITPKLLNVVMNLFAPPTVKVWLNLLSRAPS